MPDNDQQQNHDAYESDLQPKHQEFLRQRGISPTIAKVRGYRSAISREDLHKLGFQPWQGNVPALVTPIHTATGRDEFHWIRPDRPRSRKKQPVEQEQPQKTTLVLDIPASSKAILSDPSVPLWIPDSPYGADALISSGKTAIALLGYRAWRLYRRPGKPSLEDWEQVNLAGREVVLAFTSDLPNSAMGKTEIRAFTEFLRSRGAKVKHAFPSSGPDGKPRDIGEFLGAGGDPDTLIISPAAGALEVLNHRCTAADHPYIVSEEGFFLELEVDGELIPKPLTKNWTASITADILVDDGLEQRRLFQIEGVLRGRRSSFRISAEEFESLDWVLDKLGAQAVIVPGFGAKDHVRAAIQLTSGEIPVQQEYGHTGWVVVGDKKVFLHASGSIGPAEAGKRAGTPEDRTKHNSSEDQGLVTAGPVGPVSGPRMETLCANLPHELSRFSLPPPTADPDIAANRCHMALGVLEAAVPRVSYPFLSFVLRAVLGPLDFSVQLVGNTGNLKTSLAAVGQQFFGAGLDVEHLVGHWTGTANSLESLAFLLKDVLLVIDDFSPTGSKSDIQKAHRDAERLLRAKANFGGRSRARPDGTYRGARSPRSAILFTGEEIPEGHSLRARILTIETNKGDVNSLKLQCAQMYGSAGYLAEFMSTYLQWLAPRLGDISEELLHDREEWKKEEIPSTVHRRTYQAVRELEFGFDVFLRFAAEVNAVWPKWRDQLSKECWEALEQLAFSQVHFQQSADPVEQFQYLVSALFGSRQVHVCDLDSNGRPLFEPGAFGYLRRDHEYPRKTEDGEVDPDDPIVTTEWIPSGRKIGWVNDNNLYFIPEVLYAEIQGLAQRLGSPIPLTLQTLGKRLADRGVIIRDEHRGRLRHRITVEGTREYVFVVPIGEVRSLLRLDWNKDIEQDCEHLFGLDA